MNEILSDYIDDFVLVYLDDICIFSQSMEEHKKHVHLVLTRLQNHKLIVSLDK